MHGNTGLPGRDNVEKSSEATDDGGLFLTFFFLTGAGIGDGACSELPLTELEVTDPRASVSALSFAVSALSVAACASVKQLR